MVLNYKMEYFKKEYNITLNDSEKSFERPISISFIISSTRNLDFNQIINYYMAKICNEMEHKFQFDIDMIIHDELVSFDLLVSSKELFTETCLNTILSIFEANVICTLVNEEKHKLIFQLAALIETIPSSHFYDLGSEEERKLLKSAIASEECREEDID